MESPLENGEAMQILHYENRQKFETYFDYFHDKTNQALSGHLIATVLRYLSNVEKGDEIVFPNLEVGFSKIFAFLFSFLSPIFADRNNLQETQVKGEDWSHMLNGAIEIDIL